MKNTINNKKIILISPHPDDEFIGCKKFLQNYQIDSIVFITNGELCVTELPLALENNKYRISPEKDITNYIKTRRRESFNWMEQHSPNISHYYLNLSDGMTSKEIEDSYYNCLFLQNTKQTILEIATKHLKTIIKNDIILVSIYEFHPSHELTAKLIKEFTNDKIFYHSQTIINQKDPPIKYPYRRKKGWVNTISKDPNIINRYLYNYSLKEIKEKNKEFNVWYPSQIAKNNPIYINNWELYYSKLNLRI